MSTKSSCAGCECAYECPWLRIPANVARVKKLCECGCEYLCECPRLCGCSQLCECCCKCSWLRMSQILRIFATKSGCGACGSRPAQSGRVPPNMKKAGNFPAFLSFPLGLCFRIVVAHGHYLYFYNLAQYLVYYSMFRVDPARPHTR